jgi:hypothetical protein
MNGQDNKHSIAFKATKAKPGETVLHVLEGWIGEMMGKGKDTQHNGALLITTEKVCFYRKGMLGEVFETMPYDRIASIETKSLMGHRTITLHGSHDALAFKTYEQKEFFDPAHDAIEEARRGKGIGAAITAAESSETPRDRILKLKALLEEELISQQEYDTQRQRILDSI